MSSSNTHIEGGVVLDWILSNAMDDQSTERLVLTATKVEELRRRRRERRRSPAAKAESRRRREQRRASARVKAHDTASMVPDEAAGEDFWLDPISVDIAPLDMSTPEVRAWCNLIDSAATSDRKRGADTLASQLGGMTIADGSARTTASSQCPTAQAQPARLLSGRRVGLSELRSQVLAREVELSSWLRAIKKAQCVGQRDGEGTPPSSTSAIVAVERQVEDAMNKYVQFVPRAKLQILWGVQWL